MSGAAPSRATARLYGTVGGVTFLAALLNELLGKLPFNSDQGIISLMALDILERGKHPVLCYGSEYGGTAEAHYLALVFGLLGPSTTAFRIAMGALTIGVTLAVCALARAAFGERAALFSGLYLALGPGYFLYKSLTSDGGYASLLLFSALAMLVLVKAVARLRRGATATAALALFGLLCGLAWWTLPLSSALLLACGLGFLLAARVRIPFAGLAAAAGGSLAGAFPWLYHNARVGWLSLKAPEMGFADLHGVVTNVRDLFRFGWSILLGGWHVGVWGVTWTGMLLAGLFAVGLVVWGVVTVRRESDPDRRFAQVLLLAILLAPVLLSLLARRTDYREPRYLLLCYLGIAPLTGALLVAWRRRTALLTGLLALLFFLGPWNQATAPTRRHAELGVFRHDIVELARQLKQRGVTELYASYWVAYRLSFVTHQRIAASPFGNGTGLVRSLDLAKRVDGVASPAFLLYGDDMRAFDSFLEHRRVPVNTVTLGNFRLYRSLPPELIARLRSNRSLPFWMRPGDLVWETPKGPAAIPSGDTETFSLGIQNGWGQVVPVIVHLSYHWERRDGSVVVFDGARTDLPPQRFEDRGRIAVQAQVLANLPPGDYRLRFELVEEGWFWLSEMGLDGPVVDVRVTPARG